MRNCVPSLTGSPLADVLVCESFNISECNPYWVNKSHLCEIIPRIYHDWIQKNSPLKDLKFISIRERSYRMLLAFLHDEDSRIRLAAAKGLVDLVTLKNTKQTNVLQEYVHDKVI